MKEAYYFSHDANARHDPKIMKMFFVLKAEGYGIYWVIIEMLRNEPEHKLCTSDCNAIAYQAHTDVDTVKEIVHDYDLFTISEDGKYFWSESLLRRMQEFKKRSEQARNSANARWGNANAMPTQCEKDAVKESKVKQSKEKMSPQEFVLSLKTKPEYKHINIDTELAKMDTWLSRNPGRKKTPRFILRWLNKIEAPIGATVTRRIPS